jgi:hypothetical protein
MDGHFVPNLTLGIPIVEALRRVTKLPLDVHLMIENPDRYVAAFARAGASVIACTPRCVPILTRPRACARPRRQGVSRHQSRDASILAQPGRRATRRGRVDVRAPRLHRAVRSFPNR